MVVFSMWDESDPTFDVDLFVEEPFNFEEVYRRRVEAPVGTAVAHVLGLEGLLELKRQAARPQDLADIQALEAIHGEKNE